jgi:AraC-like DNA-binding protein
MAKLPPETARVPSYSRSLLAPFLRVLARRGVMDALALRPEAALERMTLSSGAELLERLAVGAHGNLAIEAGMEMRPGECGALDYAVSTAATLREAIAITAEYMHVVSDLFRARLELDEERARLCIGSEVPLSDAAQDFGMVSFFTSHARHWVAPEDGPRVWLTRLRPRDDSAHLRAFSPWPVHFGAPCAAFDFPRAALDAPLVGSDPGLHHAIMAEVQSLAAASPRPTSVSAEVAAFLRPALAHGQADVVHAAEHLGLSVRTLNRRLSREGTSFSSVLDTLRRQLAFALLSQRSLSIAQIAQATGFAEVSTFHRAFKRWAMQTPAGYRSGAADTSRTES